VALQIAPWIKVRQDSALGHKAARQGRCEELVYGQFCDNGEGNVGATSSSRFACLLELSQDGHDQAWGDVNVKQAAKRELLTATLLEG
jgi:hypothetical protein